MRQSKTERLTGSKDGGGDYFPVRAPRGPHLSCLGWPQEAALRMLMNSLDEEVAEQPLELVACGGTGKVLHDWNSYSEAARILKDLGNTQTLLIQSGKPAGVFETGAEAPRVLIMNNDLAAPASTPVLQPEEKQAHALTCKTGVASWTYVGAQEALATAFHTLDAICQSHFAQGLAGRLIVSGGMGPAGGALSLAAGMHGAAFLGIDIDEERIKRRIRGGYCDYCVNALDEALRILKNAVRKKQAVSVGLVGNCADVIPELASRGVVPDILTDLTSAHDLLKGYVPSGLSGGEAATLRDGNPDEYLGRVRNSIARHFGGMLALQKLGSVVFEFGNGMRAAASECKTSEDARAVPDFNEAYLQPLLNEGLVPVRWIALSGEAEDIRHLDELALELFPDDKRLARWISLARKYVRFQGLPARVLWMREQARTEFALRLNDLVADGSIKAPVVVALDYKAPGAFPPDEAQLEIPKDGGAGGIGHQALNAILKAATGTGWVSIQGVGDGKLATIAIIADGRPARADAISLVLKSDFLPRIIIRNAGPSGGSGPSQCLKPRKAVDAA